MSSEDMTGMADSRYENRYKLNRPGWDLELTHFEEDGCVRSVSYASIISLREISMMGLVNAITDKQDWERKVNDDAIVERWKDEVLQAPASQVDGIVDSETFDWCIKEVREKVNFYTRSKLVPIFDAEFMAAKSDVLVSDDLRQELRTACLRLMNVPHSARDYHPESNDQVLNLFHPSLYPLIYGRSRVLTPGPVPLANCTSYIGKGEILPRPGPFPFGDNYDKLAIYLWSTKYQWLPCEIKFNSDKTSEIDSYINNLHYEENSELYGLLAKFVDAAIPMWNACLPLDSDCFNKDCVGTPRIPTRANVYFDTPYGLPPSPMNTAADETRSGRTDASASNEQVAELSELEKAQVQASPTSVAPFAGVQTQEEDGRGNQAAENGSDSSQEETEDERWRRIRRLVHPRPVPFESWSRPWPSAHDLRESCDEEGLQVIFKLSSIELTPENPRYPGGSWHVEGQYNEHIAATAIYYYDCENVTESTLTFRTMFENDVGEQLRYAEHDCEGIERVYGVDGDGGDCISTLGSVVTRQGRMLCFPNNYQHKVSPVQLVDPSKPGHRRFLVMWLVDPWNKVLSTANVPPQQKDWWLREMASKKSLPLPPEITAMVGAKIEGDVPIALEEAKQMRLDLMKERVLFRYSRETHVNELFLCEH